MEPATLVGALIVGLAIGRYGRRLIRLCDAIRLMFSDPERLKRMADEADSRQARGRATDAALRAARTKLQTIAEAANDLPMARKIARKGLAEIDQLTR